MKKYYATHRKEIAERMSGYNATRRVEKADYDVKYRKAHRFEIAKKQAEYDAAHRIEKSQYRAAHRAERTWYEMHRRAGNKDSNHPSYANVRVCKRWSGPKGLQNFLKDMGQPPKGTSLSRIADSGDYKPGNVVWGTRAHQAEQKRLKKERLNKCR